jgi:hypothetical protein
MGGIQLGLDLASGATLSQATYAIDGPAGYHRSLTVSVGNSPRLSTFIGGTPPGSGYVLTVTGTAGDGVSVCSGVSAPFDVVAFRTTLVSLVLRCQQPDPTGSIQTNGSLNYCASIDMLSASSTEAPIGGTVALGSVTHDKDMGPAPIQYTWMSSSGTIDNTGAAAPTFTCTVAGMVNVTLSVTDGDCGDSRSIALTCTGPGGTAPVTPGPDAGAAPISADAGAASTGPEVDPSADQCLTCESSSGWPACLVNYNACVGLADKATAGPAAGTARNDLCVGLYTCVHATRCDAGGTFRDCFCGKSVTDDACKVSAAGPCRDAIRAAGESSDDATVFARLHDTTYALGVGATLIEECEEQPAPLCGPSCGH